MGDRPTTLGDLALELRGFAAAGRLAEGDAAEALLDPFDKLDRARYRTALQAFDTFLPPRLVRAAKRRRCITFFGAGLSAEAGVPLWWDLLSALGVSRDLIAEPELENDPLTAAEVLAHQIGLPQIDEALRGAVKTATTPATTHLLAAELYQDAYITTNYDCLFEEAWRLLHGVRPRVITTDADLAALDPSASFEKIEGRPLLFKLHGSVDRDAEELILSRSQYRRHYRTNREMFDRIRSVLSESHTLFLGFGHRDPEITRLVEDVIHAFELRDAGDDRRPAFYSLQFDMRERTPEIFAARGIVALQPPISLQPPRAIDARTVALTRSMIDLLGALDSTVHADLDLDADLSSALHQLEAEIDDAIATLEAFVATLGGSPSAATREELAACGRSLGMLAGQGIYVLDATGGTVEQWRPDALTSSRREDADFRRRPYVRQARMYREPFVSTTAASIFNGNATAFLSVPILADDATFAGLAFSAFQPGCWDTPLRLQREVRDAHTGRDVSFVLMDGEGVLLIPPNLEFDPREAEVHGEPGAANVGFPFERLRRLSRRDKLVERIRSNIVPLAQDDDVLRLGDVEMYSVAAEVKRTRWKLALSIPTDDDARV